MEEPQFRHIGSDDVRAMVAPPDELNEIALREVAEWLYDADTLGYYAVIVKRLPDGNGLCIIDAALVGSGTEPAPAEGSA